MAGESDGSRQRILGAALELLAESGYEGTSLQQVADRVGLHKSSLFHHFRSKEELAREVYRGMVEGLLKRLEPILARDPPRLDTLLEALDAAVDHFAAEPAAARLLMRLLVEPPRPRGEDPFDAPPGQEDGVMRLLGRVGDWLARARAAGVIRPVPVRATLLDLMGLVLFAPSVASTAPPELLGGDPRAPERVAARKRELRAFVRGALAP